jgi:acetolactate synthase-1/2/3 large subunit
VKLSDYVISFIANRGIKYIFTLPGGGAMHLNDSLGNSTDVQQVSNLHEQASAMAAETYAKVTGDIGVALVTTGPGGTNAMTGLAGAWLDSTPCLFVSGQVKRVDMKGSTGVRQMGLQEVDIVSIVGPLTKYAVTVTEPEHIRYELEKCFHLMCEGRPGPVWLDIPLDIQAATVDPETMRGFELNPAPRDLPLGHLRTDVRTVLSALNNADRPIVLFGNGIRLAKAEDVLLRFIDEANIPVLSTWLSVDMIDYNHPLYIGKPGTVASRGVNFALQNSDFLLTIGARLDFTITGYAPERLARGAFKVHVDIDSAELKKLEPYADLTICSDARDFLVELHSACTILEKKSRAPWMERCRDWKTRYPIVLPEHRRPDQLVSVYFLADLLSEELPADCLIVSGSSGAGIEIFQHALRIKHGQRLLHTSALGSMGYALPAAIGACIAGGGIRPTVCIEGDGSIQLNAQEFETIRRLDLPIKIFVLSNDGYSSIRTSQMRWFGRCTGADAASGLTLPDIIKVAAAYGLPTSRIGGQSQLRDDLRSILDTPGPMICDISCIPDEARIPSVSSAQRPDGTLFSKPIEDLWPFLERSEFLANMIVDPLLE